MDSASAEAEVQARLPYPAPFHRQQVAALASDQAANPAFRAFSRIRAEQHAIATLSGSGGEIRNSHPIGFHLHARILNPVCERPVTRSGTLGEFIALEAGRSSGTRCPRCSTIRATSASL